jgi:2-polyprenyl-3-methyl-5-hydroxy-6-metoxy-1,4-benzoquinol methylase
MEFQKYFQDNNADIVLGSRLKNKSSAFRGRMPWYKYFGNIILTWTQNHIAKSKISDYHTGYRAYSTHFLKSIPFELNSDDYHFDTEIILQALHVNANICEFPIPTFYGEDIFRVPLFKYLIDVLATTIFYRMQRFGLKVSLKYPRSAEQIYVDKQNHPISTHAFALNYLKEKYSSAPAKVLDVGCGPGHLAKQLPPQIQYTGIDRVKPLHSSFHSFIMMDLERDKWEIDISEYDCVLIMDVIEHLFDPEGFLLQLRNQMKRDNTSTILISTANVGFFLIRLNLFFGRFNYADRGILDITHKRLFTKASFRNLLKETGYEIVTLKGVGIPFRVFGDSWLFRLFDKISALLARLYPSLFAFQFYGEIRPKLNVYQLIQMNEEPSAST